MIILGNGQKVCNGYFTSKHFLRCSNEIANVKFNLLFRFFLFSYVHRLKENYFAKKWNGKQFRLALKV